MANRNVQCLLSKTSSKDEAYRLAGEAEEHGIGDQDIYSLNGLETRGYIHSNEAFDLIRALVNADTKQEVFDLLFTQAINSEENRRYIQVEATMTRDEIIARLEWISCLNFGNDLDAWREWMEIRQEEGFFVGRGSHAYRG
ncbi:hypothetical protein [Litoreibacter albidus]|uniref:hypothetical protein n=1 Tax=Litoreibacter albidus TaxID=670155 RepID=UPI003736F7B3